MTQLGSKTAGRLKATLMLPEGYEAELVATSLRSHGWQNLSFNEMTNEISGEKKKTERRSGINFNYDYRCQCSWSPGDAGKVNLEVIVHDEESNGTKRDCQKLSYEIIAGVESRAVVTAKKLETLPVKTTYGSDRFATTKDMEEAGYKQESVEGNSFLICPYEGGKLVLPPEESYRHAIVCGPTGCGKTSSIFIPNLIERIGVSALVTEATSGSEAPDLYAKTSGYRKAHGHNIYYFNPDDVRSVRINPVDFVTSLPRAIELAQLIMSNTGSQRFKSSGENKFWQDAEAHLLTSLLLHVASEKGDLGQVRQLIRNGPQKLGDIVRSSQYAQAWEEYEAYLNVSTESIRNGVMCGLMQRLNNWINPRVAALTSKSDVDVNALSNELFTFYLAVPSDKDGLKPVAALVLNYIINALKEIDKEKHKHPLALVLDEFTNFGYLPGLPRAMSIIRHQEIPVILGCQDYSQIKIEYGEDDTKRIFNNAATRVVFRTNDLPTAKTISESLGEETIFERKLNTSCQVVEKEVGRPLMRPSEIMALDKEMSIVFTPSTPPAKITRFHWKDYLEQTSHPRDIQPEVEIDERLVRSCAEQADKPDWQLKYEQEQSDAQESSKTSQKTDIKTEGRVSSEEYSPSTGNKSKSTDSKNADDYELPI